MLNGTAFGRDRRQEKRYAGAQAEYVFVRREEDLDNVRFRKAALRNFSKSGANFFLAEHIPSNSFILVRIYEPFVSKTTRYIHALGSLIWQQESAGEDLKQGTIIIGVKFLHLDADDAKRLHLMSEHFELSKKQNPGRF